jgi:hypothetical protein
MLIDSGGCHALDGSRVSPELPKLPNKKVVIVDTPRGSSSSIDEKIGFWIDEAAKTVVLADGTLLKIRRFDDHRITAARGDISYEFNRDNGNLAYASSTTKDGVATIIIGSGQCEIVVGR